MPPFDIKRIIAAEHDLATTLATADQTCCLRHKPIPVISEAAWDAGFFWTIPSIRYLASREHTETLLITASPQSPASWTKEMSFLTQKQNVQYS